MSEDKKNEIESMKDCHTHTKSFVEKEDETLGPIAANEKQQDPVNRFARSKTNPIESLEISDSQTKTMDPDSNKENAPHERRGNLHFSSDTPERGSHWPDTMTAEERRQRFQRGRAYVPEILVKHFANIDRLRRRPIPRFGKVFRLWS